MLQAARDGFATVQDIQDPAPVVTFARRNASGAFAPVPELTDIRLISVRLFDRDAQQRGSGAGHVETTLQGRLAGWAPLPIAVGDRFMWQGQVFEVTAPITERFGVIRALFEMRVRDRS